MICPLHTTCTRPCAHGKPHDRNEFCGKGQCHMGETECVEDKQAELERFFESRNIPFAGALAQEVMKIMEVI